MPSRPMKLPLTVALAVTWAGVLLAVEPVPAAGRPASAPRPGRYAGVTGQIASGRQATIDYRFAKHFVRNLKIEYKLDCPAVGKPLFGTVGTSLLGPFIAGGGSGNVKPSNISIKLPDGRPGTERLGFFFRLKLVGRARMTGAVQAGASVCDASGKQLDSCTMPRVAWSATRKGG